MHAMRVVSAAVIVLVSATFISANVSTKEVKRIEEAAAVLSELWAAPDKGVPQDFWNKASCVAVFPGLKKAAFVVGGEFGKGLMSCRRHGQWSAPVFMQIGKGSWGLQIGAQSIDLVLLVMNDSGVVKLLRNKVSLGAEASVAAGPVGRDTRAATDGQLKAEILSYSRTQGLFAGINLSGGVIHSDADDNKDLYGDGVTPRQVLLEETVKPPAVTESLMAALRRTSL
jgi:SH3 domain-containing YSC84-like protein 1